MFAAATLSRARMPVPEKYQETSYLLEPEPVSRMSRIATFPAEIDPPD